MGSPHHPRLTAAELAQVVHRLSLGERFSVICAALGRAEGTVRLRLKKLNYEVPRQSSGASAITRAEVEAELAKLRATSSAAPGAMPAPEAPTSASPASEARKTETTWPVAGKLAGAIARKTVTAHGRKALAEELDRITHCGITRATQTVTRLTAGGNLRLGTEAARMETRQCSCGREFRVPHYTPSHRCLSCENAAAAAESARIRALPTPAWAEPEDPFEGLELARTALTGRFYTDAELRSQR